MYRGIANRTLPESFCTPDEFNVKGGVEFGFMSTSPKREIAVHYASTGRSNQTAAVFQVQIR